MNNITSVRGWLATAVLALGAVGVAHADLHYWEGYVSVNPRTDQVQESLSQITIWANTTGDAKESGIAHAVLTKEGDESFKMEVPTAYFAQSGLNVVINLPQTVTEKGKYTLTVDENSCLWSTALSPNEPVYTLPTTSWTWEVGEVSGGEDNPGEGEDPENPEVNFTFVSDPAEGSYVDKIFNINITFPEATSVSTEKYIYPHVIGNDQDYTCSRLNPSGNVAKYKLTNAGTYGLEEEGAWTISIPEGAIKLIYENGETQSLPAFSYIVNIGTEPEVKDLPYTLVPADGATVETLSNFTLTFDNATAVSYNNKALVVTDASSNEYDTFVSVEGITATIAVANVVANGDYTLTVPEGAFTVDGAFCEAFAATVTVNKEDPVEPLKLTVPTSVPESYIVMGSGLYDETPIAEIKSTDLNTITFTFSEGIEIESFDLGDLAAYSGLKATNSKYQGTGNILVYYNYAIDETNKNVLVATAKTSLPETCEPGIFILNWPAESLVTNAGTQEEVWKIYFNVGEITKAETDLEFTMTPAVGSANEPTQVKNKLENWTITFAEGTVAAVNTAEAITYKHYTDVVTCNAQVNPQKTNEVIITSPDGILYNEGIYTLTVPKGAITVDGQDFQGVQSTINLYLPVLPTPSIVPAVGSDVEGNDLLIITVTYDPSVDIQGVLETYPLVYQTTTVTDDEGNELTEFINKVTYDVEIDATNSNVAYFKAQDLYNMKALGQYTFAIPDQLFVMEYEGALRTNSMATYKYNVTTLPTTSVEELTFGAEEEVNVYNVSGVCVLRNADREAVNSLPKGIYIVGGKKLVIK